MNYPEIPSSQGAIDGILNVFNLMQGMSNVLAVTKAHIVNSFIAPIYRELADPIPSQPMLDEVLQRLPALTSFVESKSDLSELERSVYLVAIASMRPCLQMAQSPCVDNRELRFLFFWPMSLHPDFLNLVRQRSAGALAIVMYYTTILFASQSRFFFYGRMGRAADESMLRKTQPGLASDCFMATVVPQPNSRLEPFPEYYSPATRAWCTAGNTNRAKICTFECGKLMKE
ncbi:hypothetical protein HBI70_093410 [Parastagonospora nodorum]|nr:hypothetical protein HBI10_074490 [Parastagonospora nodorum]KAH4017904.1 hypothetical protein HBI13_136640 [Parastagonospora nodorum]KAH4962078.1 hypothetical protein HBI78_138770 [Parastagonospora nodorum]KAH5035908.1 hypothetical protein HBI75_084690 [Parastagonospora nodorum]KAH5097598.1 hypothetical protein HBH72_123950 [Parastagonospora nodorum]